MGCEYVDTSGCDDGNACTADSCDDLLGCRYTPIPGCTEIPASPRSALVLLGLGLVTAGLVALHLRSQRLRP